MPLEKLETVAFVLESLKFMWAFIYLKPKNIANCYYVSVGKVTLSFVTMSALKTWSFVKA